MEGKRRTISITKNKSDRWSIKTFYLVSLENVIYYRRYNGNGEVLGKRSKHIAERFYNQDVWTFSHRMAYRRQQNHGVLLQKFRFRGLRLPKDLIRSFGWDSSSAEQIVSPTCSTNSQKQFAIENCKSCAVDKIEKRKLHSLHLKCSFCQKLMRHRSFSNLSGLRRKRFKVPEG